MLNMFLKEIKYMGVCVEEDINCNLLLVHPPTIDFTVFTGTT